MKILEFKPARFLSTRKRTAILNITTHISPTIGWSGGSCSSFLVFTLPGINIQTLIYGDHFNRPALSQEIQPGNYIVESGTFNGKPATTRVYCREDDKEAVLKIVMEPGTELTEREL